MKALEILYSMIDGTRKNVLSNKNTYERLTYIAEAIEELENLENLENKGCGNCKNNIDVSKLSDEQSISAQEYCMQCKYFYSDKFENKA